jgi:hypothetical protein
MLYGETADVFYENHTEHKCTLWAGNQSFSTMTYRPISKKQLYKQVTVKQPLLGNSSVDTFPRQWEKTQ